MDYKEAKTRLKLKIKNESEKLKIPTLGKRSFFDVQLKNVNGDEFIELCNSKNKTKLIDVKIWDSVVNRYNGLHDEEKRVASNYTADKWSSLEGNMNTVFSPYLAALLVYLK